MATPASVYRKKLLNATLFFAKKTKYLNLTKLFKLLYFLDFQHFQQTGYPSIGLQYHAFKQGPVPKDFWLEIKDCMVPEDFKGSILLNRKSNELPPYDKEVEIRAAAEPDLSVFTPRELKILDNLAFMYGDARAKLISDITHIPRKPWDTTVKAKGENQVIDYLLAIDEKSSMSIEEAQECLKEHFEAMRNFGMQPTKPGNSA